MSINSGYTLSLECILREAKFRWLKGYEVLCILQNYHYYGLQLSPAAPIEPQSGALFLFNKRVVKFRKDGVNWRKQKDGKTVRESHEKLKVGGVKVLSCCYTRSADNPSFQRRIYWLLDGDANVVLVHYLTLEKELGKEDGMWYDNSTDELEVPGSQHVLRSSLHLHSEDNNEEKKDEVSTGVENGSDEDNYETQSELVHYADNNCHINNESLRDFVNSLISPLDNNTTKESDQYQDILRTISFQSSKIECDSPSEITCCVPACLGRLAKISDFSPEWDYVEGGGKILIMGPDFHNGLNYHVMFDQVEVPAEIVQDGVLRCRIPPHFKPGYVSFCVTRGNFIIFSEVCHFEYRVRQTATDSMNMNERNFKLRIIEQLERLEREVNSSNSMDSITISESIIESLSQSFEDKYFTEKQLEEVFVKIFLNLMEGIENNDTLNAKDRDGLTLLHYACALRYQLLASRLISFGANVNVQDHNGNSPFQWAMKNGDQQMIKTLVDYVDLNKNKGACDSSSNLDSSFSPIPHTPSIDGMISGIDELGLGSSSEPPTPSPITRNKFKTRDHIRSIPGSPRTPNTRIRHTSHFRKGDKGDDESSSPSTAFKVYRTRRVEQLEDEMKKRVAHARDSMLSERRK